MTNSRHRLLVPIFFWALIAVFLLILSNMFGNMWLGGNRFLPTTALFFILSICLIAATFKTMKEGKKQGKKHMAKVSRNWKKIFLLLTGFSAAGFVIMTVLHNMFYAFAILTQHIAWVHAIMEVLHVAFFLIGVLACPLGFIVGAVGAVVMMVKQIKKK